MAGLLVARRGKQVGDRRMADIFARAVQVAISDLVAV